MAGSTLRPLAGSVKRERPSERVAVPLANRPVRKSALVEIGDEIGRRLVRSQAEALEAEIQDATAGGIRHTRRLSAPIRALLAEAEHSDDALVLLLLASRRVRVLGQLHGGEHDDLADVIPTEVEDTEPSLPRPAAHELVESDPSRDVRSVVAAANAPPMRPAPRPVNRRAARGMALH